MISFVRIEVVYRDIMVTSWSWNFERLGIWEGRNLKQTFEWLFAKGIECNRQIEFKVCETESFYFSVWNP